MRHILSFVLLALTGYVSAGASPMPFSGEKSTWHGHDCFKFTVNGRDAIVAVPETPLEGNPWVWRPAFFDAFPAIDDALVNEGFHIAYYDTTNEWGRPEAMEAGQEFYDLMVNEYGLMPRVVMEGLSRGGYYSMRRAQIYPETVACLILDNPLVDLFELKRNPEWWNDVIEKWHCGDKSPKRGEFRDNAAYNIDKMAKARIPVLLLSGGQDTVVPYERNGQIVKEVYRRYNSPIKSIVRHDGGHHPHGLDNPGTVVRFIKDAVYGDSPQKNPTKVACIGNSITEGVGTSDPASKAYPALLQNLLGQQYEVRNFGVSCSTALRKGTDAGRPFAYLDTEACRNAMEWNPDIVIIKLGGNDSKPDNWQYKEEFAHDYQEIIDTFKYLPSLPELYICLPAKARVDDASQIWGINEQVITNEIIPAIKKTAYNNRITTINLHDAYRGEENASYSDNIHPTDRGAELIADKIYKAIANE